MTKNGHKYFVTAIMESIFPPLKSRLDQVTCCGSQDVINVLHSKTCIVTEHGAYAGVAGTLPPGEWTMLSCHTITHVAEIPADINRLPDT